MGSILFYARAVDNTALKALNTIAQHTTTATNVTQHLVNQLLDYLATHPNATICYWTSKMVLKVHSNASYLNKSHTCSSYAGYLLCGDNQNDDKLLNFNNADLIIVSILKLIAASAAEAELAALFHNSQSVQKLQMSLNEMGWPQTATDIICYNTIANGIVNSTMKHHHSCAMNMKYFWIID